MLINEKDFKALLNRGPTAYSNGELLVGVTKKNGQEYWENAFDTYRLEAVENILREEYGEAFESEGCVNVLLCNTKTGEELETQGDFHKSDTVHDFAEWLIQDMKECGLGDIEDIEIGDVYNVGKDKDWENEEVFL